MYPPEMEGSLKPEELVMVLLATICNRIGITEDQIMMAAQEYIKLKAERGEEC